MRERGGVREKWQRKIRWSYSETESLTDNSGLFIKDGMDCSDADCKKHCAA